MRRWITLVVLAVATACGGSDATSPTQVTFAGTYTLRTVNGSNLPYVLLQSGQNSSTITADAITIADGGSWSESGNLASRVNGVTSNQTYSDNGTWLRSGNSLSLHSTAFNNTAYNGAFTSNQLSLTDVNGFVFVFSR